jgi:hypothetical protein
VRKLDLDTPCGRYLRLRDLIEAGETWRESRTSNLPEQAETITALHRLAADIIDPVISEFGHPEITYGFASHALTRLIPGRIDPSRDQHAGHERKSDGTPICPRLGQAVDFRVLGMCSGRIAAWIAHHLPFDRMYFYGPESPLHVSVGPEEKRMVVTMMVKGPSGRRVPQMRAPQWLRDRYR